MGRGDPKATPLSKSAMLCRPAPVGLATLLAWLALATLARAETILHLAETATVMVAPDELAATLHAEATGASASDAQARVNTAMQQALAQARKIDGIAISTGGYGVWRTGSTSSERNERWQVSQTLSLNGRDGPSMLNLVGVLQQQGLAVGSLGWRLSSAAERQAHQAATKQALSGLRGRVEEAAALLDLRFGQFKEVTPRHDRPTADAPRRGHADGSESRIRSAAIGRARGCPCQRHCRGGRHPVAPVIRLARSASRLCGAPQPNARCCTLQRCVTLRTSARLSPRLRPEVIVQQAEAVMTPDIGLGNWLYQRALRTPHRKALTFEGTTWSYAQLQDRIDRLANGLHANGICQGDRVGFLGFNQPAFLETLFAAARLGAIFVPLNYRLTTLELSYIITNAGIHSLVADAPHRPVIDPIRDQLPCRRFFSADHPAEGWPAIQAMIEAHAPIRLGAAVADDDTAIIMYTSGTTGRPKGAMLTHGNIWWNNINVLLAYDVRESDTSLLIAPLFHIGGLNVNSIVIWQKGGHIVLHRTFDAARCLEDIARYQHNHAVRGARDAAVHQPAARFRHGQPVQPRLHRLRGRPCAGAVDAALCRPRCANQSGLRHD